jgi:hypothetical protein
MAWKNVVSYSFGFGQTDKKFWIYYTLDGSTSAAQIFLTAAQFAALSQAFGSATSISFETTGKYFATGPRNL